MASKTEQRTAALSEPARGTPRCTISSSPDTERSSYAYFFAGTRITRTIPARSCNGAYPTRAGIYEVLKDEESRDSWTRGDWLNRDGLCMNIHGFIYKICYFLYIVPQTLEMQYVCLESDIGNSKREREYPYGGLETIHTEWSYRYDRYDHLLRFENHDVSFTVGGGN